MDLHGFDLNLRHLRALSVIVARGNLSAAAAAVSLSQPALTLGLAKLERQIGVPLFERRADGMVPTREGRLFADRASRTVSHLADAARAIAPGGPRGFARPEQLMTSTQLRAFLAFADAGSFVGAAATTGLSSPTLHRAVRDLEQICRVRLIDARGRGVVMTEAGRRIARGIRLGAAELTAAIAESHPDANTGASARLSIGAMPLCRAVLLPAALTRLAHAVPRITVDVVEGAWRDLAEPLRDGSIDLMIGALRSDGANDLEQHALFEDRLVIVARAGHPLSGRSDVSPEDLARYPWITGQGGSPLHDRWMALFAGHTSPAAPIACGSIMVARGVLGGSDFLTLASPDQVALEIRSGLLAQIGEPLTGTTRTIGVTTRRGWRPTTIQSQFIALLEGITAIRSVSISQ